MLHIVALQEHPALKNAYSIKICLQAPLTSECVSAQSPAPCKQCLRKSRHDYHDNTFYHILVQKKQSETIYKIYIHLNTSNYFVHLCPFARRLKFICSRPS